MMLLDYIKVDGISIPIYSQFVDQTHKMQRYHQLVTEERKNIIIYASYHLASYSKVKQAPLLGAHQYNNNNKVSYIHWPTIPFKL